ncbi:MAG: hypothetical protein AB1894_19755 [Chloroflexota bacterium]
MSKQSKNLPKPIRRKTDPNEAPTWVRLLLSLTLVPLVAGVLLIIAWMLDLEIMGDPQRLLPVGTFFVVFSFAASNLLQKNWLVGAGWSLVSIAMLLLWISTASPVLVAAFVLGILGIMMLGFEYFRRIAESGKSKKR